MRRNQVQDFTGAMGKVQDFVGGAGKYVRPFINMGNSRGTFGSFYPSSTRKPKPAKPKKGTKDIAMRAMRNLEISDGDDVDLEETPMAEDWTKGRKKDQKKRKKEIAQEQENGISGEAGGQNQVSREESEQQRLAMRRLPLERARAPREEPKASDSTQQFQPLKDQAYLQQAVLWAEILGDPVSKKRRKKRIGQLYGNQSNAYRG